MCEVDKERECERSEREEREEREESDIAQMQWKKIITIILKLFSYYTFTL